MKVLAELVERHIQEEEEDIFPTVKSVVDEEMLINLSEKYVAIQAEIIAEGQDDSPHEGEMTNPDLTH